MTRGGRPRRWAKVLGASAVLVAVGAGLFLARSRLFPGSIDRARAAYNRQDWDGATAFALGRLKEAPGDRDALRLLARSAARGGRDESARALYSRLGGASGFEAEDFFVLGRSIDKTGDHETARACWVAGLRADPRNAEILNEFVRLYLNGAQPDLAERAAKALAERPGWEARGAFLLGRIALERDDPEAAATHLERGLDLDPSALGAPRSAAHYVKLLARALLRSGKPKEAARRLRGVLAKGPDAEGSWLLSRAALRTGDTAEGVAALASGASYRDEHTLEPEPSPYIGSARCGSCHQEEYKAEQSSLHARTFQHGPTIKDVPIPGRPLADPANPAVTHSIEQDGGRLRYTAKEQGETFRAVVEYVFGSGRRGLTLVGRDDAGRTRELRLSHYADIPSWDVTAGHAAAPRDGEGYLGRILSSDDLHGCLACHTTTPRAARDGVGVTSSDRGIGCERCHGPGETHLKAVAVKFPDLAIAQPRAASGAEVVGLCGQCHSPLSRSVSPTDPIAVRFPATTLTWSRCYTESAGGFDCRTCHDPHRDLATAPASYEAKCRSCHSKTSARDARVCSVNANDGCVSCHMPKAKIEVPHAVFTDHHIRVHATPSDKNIHE